jgi:hypothetical protein
MEPAASTNTTTVNVIALVPILGAFYANRLYAGYPFVWSFRRAEIDSPTFGVLGYISANVARNIYSRGALTGLPLATQRTLLPAEGVWLEPTSGVDDHTAALVWLVSALEQAYTQGQVKLIDYLETIADDVVFEMEMAARRASLLSRMTLNKTT